ncbi:MOSC domain-containing protein [Rhodobacteraceae bacterium 2CG4]|uniref:MOSC domain-containing protein n=1 Tax=Halovulum marinum TaxID=2662447 RepID=A0A6L5YVD8_9RHOB|nr:MOSC domain-containing protein [Halovulum marinum]MSU88366.1 MOSC domain-containing protein [Halovulum marinum]
MLTVTELTSRAARPGLLVWIGVRPARRAPVQCPSAVEVTESGLAGDHRQRPGKRAITLIQAEHLPVIRALAANDRVVYADLRRNLAVAGINLLALRDRRIRIGELVLAITGPCAPCSRMEEALGHGGYAAVRGHGGMIAEVIRPGRIEVGDRVWPLVDGPHLPDEGC